MIAVKSKLTRATHRLIVSQHRPDSQYMRLDAVIIDDPLLAEGHDLVVMEGGPNALRESFKLTPFGQQFAQLLFGPQPTGVVKMMLSPNLMAITYEDQSPFGVEFYQQLVWDAVDANRAISDALDID
ncbi:MAG: hypothetical protein ABIR37_02600 [Candidatus Saccharimonadales bacterium]